MKSDRTVTIPQAELDRGGAPSTWEPCECGGEVVPGAGLGFNGRNEVQRCDICEWFASDDDAAAAVAARVGGQVVERHDPDRSSGAWWLVVVKAGREMTEQDIEREAYSVRRVTGGEP
ncbi:hypothetical protein Psed_6846 (plasmid) [Pseudonocardia dioxanivorans CB1190]|uniref:Uncharacterized protein n=1 Tax=Pseudonocardia dioxanivorans (strain ATCC 55486 / DSM 44775 / JCM 13855 / CB1190) TaxID=675635 RepID=F2L6M3_PSEUX|nr:hypothetical protein [Pseudonocardia dioxanivorans]AEA28917.1 hypothetical protein Psed_6846 [Pseudonocardia dioxanivorans CB1190]